ncbi:hypothetical protein ADU59_14305 [Pararhizobium polonicum]|uniref:Uncharacterized protein n=1 Tax=Pararhizobium polonicum TaxID=1612624 RepID=A0A1C7P110_9HYPH|nr:hypothetical protein ADU59_14305 [Pararhizobium polonicum]
MRSAGGGPLPLVFHAGIGVHQRSIGFRAIPFLLICSLRPMPDSQRNNALKLKRGIERSSPVRDKSLN